MKNRKKLVITLIGVIVLGIGLFVYQKFIKKQLHFKENLTVEIITQRLLVFLLARGYKIKYGHQFAGMRGSPFAIINILTSKSKAGTP